MKRVVTVGFATPVYLGLARASLQINSGLMLQAAGSVLAMSIWRRQWSAAEGSLTNHGWRELNDIWHDLTAIARCCLTEEISALGKRPWPSYIIRRASYSRTCRTGPCWAARVCRRPSSPNLHAAFDAVYPSTSSGVGISTPLCLRSFPGGFTGVVGQRGFVSWCSWRS